MGRPGDGSTPDRSTIRQRHCLARQRHQRCRHCGAGAPPRLGQGHPSSALRRSDPPLTKLAPLSPRGKGADDPHLVSERGWKAVRRRSHGPRRGSAGSSTRAEPSVRVFGERREASGVSVAIREGRWPTVCRPSFCRGGLCIRPQLRLQLLFAVREEQRAAQRHDGEDSQHRGDGGHAAGALV